MDLVMEFVWGALFGDQLLPKTITLDTTILQIELFVTKERGAAWSAFDNSVRFPALCLS